jgi:23S rRNA pseudouridine1911/1915/1917 synthase
VGRYDAKRDAKGRTLIRWVVREGDGSTVGAIVERAGGDAEAVRDGRVFVGRVRVRDEEAHVEVGDEVTFAERLREEEGRGGPLRVLVDEEGLVAVDKPAGMPTIPDHGGAAHSLVAVLAKSLGCALADLHATSRLDRDVSGVVIFARTEEAARRLLAAREAGHYVRRYVAIAGRGPQSPTHKEAHGEWDVPIGRAKDPRHRAAFGCDAAFARTRHATVARAGERSLLALEPVTGRTHQLRVHAAYAGMPLLGDRTYGGETRLTFASGRVVRLGRIALHAGRVLVPRQRGGFIDLRAEVPALLRELWMAIGGEDSAWVAALEGPSLESAS